jgi:hypothetical protein
MMSSDVTITDVDNAFWGIVLEEGEYLTLINYTAAFNVENLKPGTPNNGYRMDLGFGGERLCDPNDPLCGKGGGDCDDYFEGSPEWIELGCGGGEVPEPGTIFLLGTGIVGLGVIARRKMAKK